MVFIYTCIHFKVEDYVRVFFCVDEKLAKDSAAKNSGAQVLTSRNTQLKEVTR